MSGYPTSQELGPVLLGISPPCRHTLCNAPIFERDSCASAPVARRGWCLGVVSLASAARTTDAKMAFRDVPCRSLVRNVFPRSFNLPHGSRGVYRWIFYEAILYFVIIR